MMIFFLHQGNVKQYADFKTFGLIGDNPNRLKVNWLLTMIGGGLNQLRRVSDRITGSDCGFVFVLSFDSKEWKNVSACFRTSSTSCNVTSSIVESEYGCVMLRVRAERHGLKSQPVQACSRQGKK